MFKGRVRRLWEEWLTSLLEQVDEVCNATHEEVSEWMPAVYWEMVGLRILRNCCRKTGYNWFPDLVDQEDVVAGDFVVHIRKEQILVEACLLGKARMREETALTINSDATSASSPRRMSHM